MLQHHLHLRLLEPQHKLVSGPKEMGQSLRQWEWELYHHMVLQPLQPTDMLIPLVKVGNHCTQLPEALLPQCSKKSMIIHLSYHPSLLVQRVALFNPKAGNHICMKADTTMQ